LTPANCDLRAGALAAAASVRDGRRCGLRLWSRISVGAGLAINHIHLALRRSIDIMTGRSVMMSKQINLGEFCRSVLVFPRDPTD